MHRRTTGCETKRMPKPNFPSSFVWAGISALFLFLCVLTFDLIEEDAYIYFRFAANIANGYGYVFNQSGPPVESGSSLVWQLLLVPLYFIDSELVISTKIMGICFGLLSLIMTHKVTTCYVPDRALSFIPVLWLACSYPFFLWSHLGLETPLLIFLSLTFVYCVIEERAFRYWPLAGFLVVNVRPEGFMLGAILIPTLFITSGPRIKLRQIFLFVALICPVVIFRLLYFHDVVPNSFYHKIIIVAPLAWKTLWGFLSHSLVIIPFTVGVAAIFFPRIYSYKFVVLITATAVSIVWGAVGADLKFFDRSFAIALPFIYITAVYSLSVMFERLTIKSNRPKSAFVAVLALFGAALLFGSKSGFAATRYHNPLLKIVDKNLAEPYTFSERVAHLFTPHQHLDRSSMYWPFLYDNHQAIVGEFLAINYPKGISIVYSQMGQVPWYAGLDKHFIDSVGLVNRFVGYALFNYKMQYSSTLRAFNAITNPIIRLFDEEKRDNWTRQKAVDFIFDQKPEVIILNSLIRKDANSVPGMIANDERLDKYYAWKYSINLAHVYERKDFKRDKLEVSFPKNCRCFEVTE